MRMKDNFHAHGEQMRMNDNFHAHGEQMRMNDRTIMQLKDNMKSTR